MSVDDRATRRNRLAGMLLPALVIGAVHVAVARPAANEDLEETRRELATTTARVPDAATLRAATERASTLREEVRQAREARVAAAEPSVRRFAAPGEDVSTWLARVTAILSERGVVVLADESSATKLPPEIRDRLADAGRGGSTVRRMQLAGAYSSVVRALDAIRRADPNRLVLGLVMEVDSVTGALKWTVTLG